MANPEQIEQELRNFLEEEGNLSKQDRFLYLKAIFDKHFGLDRMDHVVNSGDVHDIISYAKALFPKTKLPIEISRKTISNYEVNHILIIESFIMYLNKHKLLKKLVKFDFTR